jgi:hypothetical protein
MQSLGKSGWEFGHAFVAVQRDDVLQTGKHRRTSMAGFDVLINRLPQIEA